MFKVGDVVQIKDWDELVQEFGVQRYFDESTQCDMGYIKCDPCFNPNMQYMCGCVVTIEGVYNTNLIITEERIERQNPKGRNWLLSFDMVKPYNPPDVKEVSVGDWERLLSAE